MFIMGNTLFQGHAEFMLSLLCCPFILSLVDCNCDLLKNIYLELLLSVKYYRVKQNQFKDSKRTKYV